jgi:signal transduction histidine kinase
VTGDLVEGAGSDKLRMAKSSGMTFRIRDLVATIGDLTGHGLERDDFIAAVLETLVEMGFGRSQFYEIAFDVVRAEKIAVLTGCTSAGAISPDLPIGLTVSPSSSGIAAGGWQLDPVVGDFPVEGGDCNWVDALRLRGRCWVEIPVTEGKQVTAILVCDWDGSRSQLEPADLRALRIVGSQVGSYLGLKPIEVLERYRASREERAAGATEPEELVSAVEVIKGAIPYLAEVTDAAAIAVFQFFWPAQRLSKIDEFIAEDFEEAADRRGWLPESYGVDEHLTGTVWTDDRFAHVVSFESLVEQQPDLVCEKYGDWHEEVLGTPIKTVVYETLGALDPRYLVRLINRAKRPNLPFLRTRELLEALVGELRSDVDAALAMGRSQTLQEITRFTAEVDEPDEVVSRIVEPLKEECVEQFAVLCHQQESRQFGFATFRGWARSVSFDLAREWEHDSLYAAAAGGKLGVLRLADYQPRIPGSLAAILHHVEARAVLSLPIQSGETRGALLIPLATLPTRRHGERRSDLPLGCDFGTASLLHAYSRLVGHAVERKYSRAKTDGARRALGFVGHELRAPIAKLGSAAEQAIVVSERAMRALPPVTVPSARAAEVRSMRHQLQTYQERLWREQQYLDSALELARVVAQESAGTLQLHLERASLARVILGTLGDVEASLPVKERRRYEFVMADSAKRLGDVVCDPSYLAIGLRNIVQNAVKYSLPRRRPPGAPMMIEVMGEPQANWIGIKIRNYGLGVPDDKRDLIFEPWVRGDLEDRYKAIRGMGLGLFLTKRILTAHGGEVLYTSRFVLNDKSRQARLEGYETVFELRLPTDLAPGTYTHRWDDVRRSPPRAREGMEARYGRH